MGEGTTSPNTEGWRDTHRSTPYVRSIRSHAHVRCVWRWVFTLELCSAACRTMMASSGGAGERRGTEQMRLFAHNGGNTYFSTLTGWPRAAYWTAALSAARRTREASIKVLVLACFAPISSFRNWFNCDRGFASRYSSMPGPPPRQWDTWKHLVAGSTAGLASTAATYPLDTLKVAFLSLTLSLAPRTPLAAPGVTRASSATPSSASP